MAQTNTPEGFPDSQIFEVRSRLGEGPVWDPEAGCLYWVDIYNHRVHRYDPATRQDTIFRLPEIVTCVVPTTSSRLLVTLRHDIALLDPGTGHLRRLLTVEGELEGNRFNDGKVDPRGRLWIGTMSPAAPGEAALYRYDPDGSLHHVESGLTISNGLGWSPDQRTFYHTDSGEQVIYRYDYDPETGEAKNRRTFADLRGGPGAPDGLAVDEEGCVWSAQWDGWCVIRFDPRGREIQRVDMPVPRPTSCAFGGPDLKTLYITSASVALSQEQIQSCPSSGDLFWVEVDVAGLPITRFDGTGF